MLSGFFLTIALLFAFGVLLPFFLAMSAWLSVRSDHKKAKLHVFHHEAAHAVLAATESLGFESISVLENGVSMGRVNLLIHHRIDEIIPLTDNKNFHDDVEALEDHLKVLLAGYAVEDIVFNVPMPSLQKNFGDMEEVNTLLTKNPCLYENFPEGKNGYFRVLQDQSKDLVRTHLTEIDLLVGKLKECPEMTEKEVLDFLAQQKESALVTAW